MRVLLSAFAFSPYKGSEPLIGWNFANRLARHGVDVTVLYGDLSASEPNRHDLDLYLASSTLPPNLHTVHIPSDSLTRKIHDLHAFPGMWFLYYPAYRLWQRSALKVAQKLHMADPFDAVHHLTIMGYREPGDLWKMNIPFFWGPVSGAPMVPYSFTADFSLTEKFRWISHRLLNTIQMNLRGRYTKAANIAQQVWTVAPEDQKMFRDWGIITEPMSELGCETDIGTLRMRNDGEPLRICWSGLFQGRKALPLLLNALAQADTHAIELDVMGSGAESERWMQLASELKIHNQVKWHGMLPRDSSIGVMQRSHVLIHTSLKEASSTVVLEAIEMGLPVICHDACGMGTIVNEHCGIKVPLVNPQTSIAGFKSALEQLASNPELLQRLSAGAIIRSKELGWDSKILSIAEAYRRGASHYKSL